MTDSALTDSGPTERAAVLSTEELQHHERVLVICAHPDDVDFGAAGTVAALVAAGVPVSYCMVTQGQAGSSDPHARAEDIAALRMTEQRAAASVVGVTDVRFLDHPDGAVVASIELRRDLSRVIRQVRPTLVITQPTERNLERVYASHPDHLATADAAMSAVYPDARNAHAHRELLDDEGLEPWSVPEIWMMGLGVDLPANVTVIIDTTEVIDRKVAALRSHRSQTSSMEDLDGMVRGWGEVTATAAGLPAGRTAEQFRRIDTR